MADQFYRVSGSTDITDQSGTILRDPVKIQSALSGNGGRLDTLPVFGGVTNDPAKSGGGSGGLDQAETGLVNRIANAPEPKSEADTIALRRSQAQGSIDAINKAFDSIINQDKERGKVNESQTNAENVARGLVGAPDAFKALDDTRKNTDDVVAADETKRGLQISQILQQVDAAAVQEAETNRQNFIQEGQTAINDIEAMRTARANSQATGRTNFQNLLAAGVNLADFKLKAPDYYKKMLDQAGMDDTEASLLSNAYSTAANKVDYKYHQYDATTGLLTMWGQDAAGNFKEQTLNVRAPQGGLPANIDFSAPKTDAAGNLVFIPKHFTGDPSTWQSQIYTYKNGQMQPAQDIKLHVPKNGGGKGSGANGSWTPTEKITNTNNVFETLKSAVGGDGHVSPEDWAIAKQMWIDNKYGTAKQFDTQFGKQFVNPDHPEDYD